MKTLFTVVPLWISCTPYVFQAGILIGSLEGWFLLPKWIFFLSSTLHSAWFVWCTYHFLTMIKSISAYISGYFVLTFVQSSVGDAQHVLQWCCFDNPHHRVPSSSDCESFLFCYYFLHCDMKVWRMICQPKCAGQKLWGKQYLKYLFKPTSFCEAGQYCLNCDCLFILDAAKLHFCSGFGDEWLLFKGPSACRFVSMTTGNHLHQMTWVRGQDLWKFGPERREGQWRLETSLVAGGDCGILTWQPPLP